MRPRHAVTSIPPEASADANFFKPRQTPSTLGLTVPDESGLSFGSPADDDESMDPEAAVRSIDAIVSFIALLAPPPRTRTDTTLEDRGEAIFDEVGCGACHVPTLRTADGVDVHAYTDLLLHDFAEPNALGIEEGDAGMHELRTPPLWGLVQTAPYLHDGRASTIEGAVSEHAGEASSARTEAANLSTGDKDALFAFLRSL